MPASSTPAPRRRIALLGSAAALTTLLLGGCVIAPLGHHYPTQPDYGPTVDVEPPPPHAESPPPAPAVGYIWIGGHWAWHLGRHVWIGGRWSVPPRGYRGWAPGGWHRHDRGWRWRGGHWRR